VNHCRTALASWQETISRLSPKWRTAAFATAGLLYRRTCGRGRIPFADPRQLQISHLLSHPRVDCFLSTTEEPVSRALLRTKWGRSGRTGCNRCRAAASKRTGLCCFGRTGHMPSTGRRGSRTLARSPDPAPAALAAALLRLRWALADRLRSWSCRGAAMFRAR
jgi:hypothetical protein